MTLRLTISYGYGHNTRTVKGFTDTSTVRSEFGYEYVYGTVTERLQVRIRTFGTLAVHGTVVGLKLRIHLLKVAKVLTTQ